MALAAQPNVPGQAHPERASKPAAILLADTAKKPRVKVSWTSSGGDNVQLEGERGYRSPADKARLGKNIDCYVALGGTRLDKGGGHPDGAVVRVGLYKADASKPFFEDLADSGAIIIRLEGVRMNQPAGPHCGTGLMHVRYSLDDLASCGISPEGRNLYITESKDDRVLKLVAADSARPGALDGGAGHGSVAVERHDDGTLSLEFKVPYALLRHVKDPSRREVPGGFFEPQHFHCEFELLPDSPVPAPGAAKPPPQPDAKSEQDR
jgi:hypothetical protein